MLVKNKGFKYSLRSYLKVGLIGKVWKQGKIYKNSEPLNGALEIVIAPGEDSLLWHNNVCFCSGQ